jgi:UDP-N-acetylglucosamine:LPS N-acetylglucosamine transferase
MKILVAPLNWGLGHATRCMPIIDSLIDEGCEVVLASDGRSGDLLKAEYPQLMYYKLPSYDITYDTKNFVWLLFKQSPKALMAILNERKTIQKLVQKESISVIISDNRFGCIDKNTHSIYLTHQTYIIPPTKWLEGIINGVNKRYISKFSEVWIADVEQTPGMAGVLSHNHSFRAKYLGILSRMQRKTMANQYDICILLSGPEPQRTQLEFELLEQANELKGQKIIVIQGKTDERQSSKLVHPNLEIVSFLTTKELNRVFLQSKMIVSRSGYSTIMDLHRLKKKALLIPTPGQTEQEVLAESFNSSGVCDIQKQGAVDLKHAFDNRDKYSGFAEKKQKIQIQEFIRQWLDQFALRHNLVSSINGLGAKSEH